MKEYKRNLQGWVQARRRISPAISIPYTHLALCRPTHYATKLPCAAQRSSSRHNLDRISARQSSKRGLIFNDAKLLRNNGRVLHLVREGEATSLDDNDDDSECCCRRRNMTFIFEKKSELMPRGEFHKSNVTCVVRDLISHAQGYMSMLVWSFVMRLSHTLQVRASCSLLVVTLWNLKLLMVRQSST